MRNSEKPAEVDKSDLYGGMILIAATMAALLVANSSWGPQFTALLHATGENDLER
jgi:NhaA family Na+:H+ antiporter